MKRPSKNARRGREADGGGWAWGRIRGKVLARDKGRCGLGYEGCLGVATEVHHMDDEAYDDGSELGGLVSVCEACHQRETTKALQEQKAAEMQAKKLKKKMSHPGIKKEFRQ